MNNNIFSGNVKRKRNAANGNLTFKRIFKSAAVHSYRELHQHFTNNFINCTIVFSEAFFYVQFGFVIFWQQNTVAKAACKMLVELISNNFNITGTFFTDILVTKYKIEKAV